jgi:nucleoid-associated protein YgaU
MKKTFSLLFTLVLGTALMVGCAAKKMETKEEPTEAAPKTEVLHYTVVPHDTLWDIAGRSKMYGDSFQWPLIFKANRDKIQDPDLIYPKQDFEVQKNIPSDAVSEARKLSSETPKYKKHAKPVKKLSVDYF